MELKRRCISAVIRFCLGPQCKHSTLRTIVLGGRLGGGREKGLLMLATAKYTAATGIAALQRHCFTYRMLVCPSALL